MRRMLLAATVATMLAGAGFVAAQAPGPKGDDHSAHHPGNSAGAAPNAKSADGATPKGPGMMGGGMMGGGMCPMMGGGTTGGGMMGGGMMAGMMGGGMMGSAATKVEVKKVDKGVTITLTSSDAAIVVRLQKMAEAMRLMHEATAQ